MNILETFKDFLSKYPFLCLGVILVLISAIGYIPLGDKTIPITEATWRFIVLVVGMFLIVREIFREHREKTLPLLSLDSVEGGIRRPENNATVASDIEADGWARNIGRDQHLWLVVEVNQQLWPKEGEISLSGDGNWHRTVFELGAVNTFRLSLYVANAEGHRRILEWLDLGSLINFHPFEQAIPGTRRLVFIDNLHR